MTRTLRAAGRDLLRNVRPGDRWLVAVAHPDDETFGCGSAIARAAALGAEVTVAVREAELHRAAALLGVSRVELLGYRDSGFDGEPPTGSRCAAPLDAVAHVLERLLNDLRPTVVVVLDGSDGHRDHRLIRAAMHAAVQRARRGGTLPDGMPQLYEHSCPTR